MLKNELHLPSMDHNLISHFIKRAGGFIINDFPKIHCEDPEFDDHIILFDQFNLHIPLQLLNSVFSYFHTR